MLPQEFTHSSDPIALVLHWQREAAAAGVAMPEAMALATQSPDTGPSLRMVLLRGCDSEGFVFYTCYDSRKAAELEADPRASLMFWWNPLERQVRIEGTVSRVDPSLSDAYWATRPRGSRIAASISPQSQTIGDRSELEAAFASKARELGDADPPRPENWGGYRVRPERLEFWCGREDRLHDRLRFTRRDGGWVSELLAP